MIDFMNEFVSSAQFARLYISSVSIDEYEPIVFSTFMHSLTRASNFTFTIHLHVFLHHSVGGDEVRKADLHVYTKY